MALQAVAKLRRLAEADTFAGAHGDELIASFMQAGKSFPGGVAAWRGLRGERLPHRRQHFRIHRIGFRQETCGAGEVAGAGWIDPGIGQALCVEDRSQMAIIMARRLEDREGLLASLQPFRQGADGLAAVWKALGPPALRIKNVEMGFGDVDSDYARVYNHGACPCDAGSAANSPVQLFRLNCVKAGGTEPAQGPIHLEPGNEIAAM